MVLLAVPRIVRPLIVGMCLVVLVSADNSDHHSSTRSESRTSSKRGVGGALTGVPGVLFSQYSPHVQPVPVPHPFPVPIPHPVPVQVPRPFPVTVHKPVGIPVPVGVPVPVNVPVPRPYPVPVPVNLPGGASTLHPYGGPFSAFPGDGGGPYAGGPFSGSPYSSGYFSGGPSTGSPFSGNPYSAGLLGSSGHSALGKLGYGLGIYSSGSPSVPLGHPALAAVSLSPHSSEVSSYAGAGLLGHSEASHLTEHMYLAQNSPKY